MTPLPGTAPPHNTTTRQRYTTHPRYTNTQHGPTATPHNTITQHHITTRHDHATTQDSVTALYHCNTKRPHHHTTYLHNTTTHHHRPPQIHNRTIRHPSRTPVHSTATHLKTYHGHSHNPGEAIVHFNRNINGPLSSTFPVIPAVKISEAWRKHREEAEGGAPPATTGLLCCCGTACEGFELCDRGRGHEFERCHDAGTSRMLQDGLTQHHNRLPYATAVCQARVEKPRRLPAGPSLVGHVSWEETAVYRMPLAGQEHTF